MHVGLLNSTLTKIEFSKNTSKKDVKKISSSNFDNEITNKEHTSINGLQQKCIQKQ